MSATFAPATLERLSVHAGDWLEDLLGRLDPHGGVAQTLTHQLTAYLDLSSCRGKRLLDFGCGVGASSLAMARLLPETEIVGVELNAEQVEIGNHLRDEQGLTNLRFLASPAGDQLPPDLGTFDYVMLSAVYEHLLPHERRVTMPLIWNALKPGGILFINQTPHRWFPKEHHTTGLWGLNYLPAPCAHALGRRVGKYPNKGTWADYLRAGIRGGTERSMQRDLGPTAHVLQPRTTDRAGYWFQHLSPSYRPAKRGLMHAFRISDRLLGTVPGTHVDVAFQKH